MSINIDASPDVYSLTIPADGFEDVTEWTASGELEITFTPEQADEFAEYVRENVGGHDSQREEFNDE